MYSIAKSQLSRLYRDGENLVEKRGEPPNLRRNLRSAALTAACYNRHLEVAEILIEAGIDVNHVGGYHPISSGFYTLLIR